MKYYEFNNLVMDYSLLENRYIKETGENENFDGCEIKFQENIGEEIEKIEMFFEEFSIQLWYLKDPYTYFSANEIHADFIGRLKEDLYLKKIKEVFNEKK